MLTYCILYWSLCSQMKSFFCFLIRYVTDFLLCSGKKEDLKELVSSIKSKCHTICGVDVLADRLSAPDSSSVGWVLMMWVRILVMLLVSLSKTFTYNCFSSPRGKRVPVRAEMVLVIDSAWCATFLAAQAVYSQGSWDGSRNETIGTVTPLKTSVPKTEDRCFFYNAAAETNHSKETSDIRKRLIYLH